MVLHEQPFQAPKSAKLCTNVHENLLEFKISKSDIYKTRPSTEARNLNFIRQVSKGHPATSRTLAKHRARAI